MYMLYWYYTGNYKLYLIYNNLLLLYMMSADSKHDKYIIFN